jgi:hypothetical protein
MKVAAKIGLMMMLTAVLAVGAPIQNPPKPKVDYTPLVGQWALQIDAGGEYYFLVLELKLNAGKLEGQLSEQNGLFTNAPLSNIEFDGEALKFDAKTPTPPDGAERLLKTEVKLVADKLEGMITIVEMNLSVPLTGTKK